jgi:hypothetical protein
MRATRLLIAVAVLAMAGLTVLDSGAERVGVDPDEQLLAAAAGEAGDGRLEGFDGRLYADAETGCIYPWPGDADDDVRREDVEAPPRVSPRDRTVLVQEAPEDARPDGPPEATQPDRWPPIHRGPWPLCDSPPSAVSDGLGDP